MELYIHIPFCVRKCFYCDFLSFEADKELKSSYIDTLIKELGSFSGLLKTVPEFDTVFIGGGTPSILDVETSERLLAAVMPMIGDDTEYTVECNPGTLDREKLELYRKYGVNRLSIGLQSADDDELARLGRIHRYEDFLKSYEAARKAGFKNINIDLMSGIPGQSVTGLERNLKTVGELEPEHISAYSLIIEPGTRYYKIYEENAEDNGDKIIPLPKEEEEREMYRLTERILNGYGYLRYEISNYSKPGFKCRHNLGYWTGEEYLGVGIGAASYFHNERYKNTDDIRKYIKFVNEGGAEALLDLRIECEHIGFDERVEEYIILRLRLTEGISKEDFMSRFGFDISDKYQGIINKHVENGLLADTGDRIFLTERGLDLSNFVMSDFLR
ncbi:MAG: radical SAM family heme chaperone HemW [Lachnospiraceae bacterium]|nr:radical SAM family heme chaperone HemW [Lachnospiraceae bacterium]